MPLPTGNQVEPTGLFNSQKEFAVVGLCRGDKRKRKKEEDD
jgi:hypothetical protein